MIADTQIDPKLLAGRIGPRTHVAERAGGWFVFWAGHQHGGRHGSYMDALAHAKAIEATSDEDDNLWRVRCGLRSR